MSFSEDKVMGNWNEKKLITYLNAQPENKDNQYKFFKNEFNTMDLYNQFYTCELKSRRCPNNQYETTMIGHNKVVRALNDVEVSYRFYFLFTDGLWCWDFDSSQFSVATGGRCDRGKDEFKDYAYINMEHLNFITDSIVSNR